MASLAAGTGSRPVVLLRRRQQCAIAPPNDVDAPNFTAARWWAPVSGPIIDSSLALKAAFFVLLGPCKLGGDLRRAPWRALWRELCYIRYYTSTLRYY